MRKNADVAIESLDAVVGDVARAAEKSARRDRRRGQPFRTPKYFAQAASSVTVFRPESRSARRPDHRAPPLGSVRESASIAWMRLEIGRWPAELPALARVGDAFPQEPLGGAHDMAAICSRPRSSTFHRQLESVSLRAQPKMRWHASVLKTTSQIWAPLLSHLLFGLPIDMPGVRAGTMKAEIPEAPGFDGSLRASSVNILRELAW